TLDYIISLFIAKPIGRIKPVTLNALRMAIFQILYMDKVPVSAAVNESVKLVKYSKENYNASFVNAILRNFLRKGAVLPEDNSADSLKIRYSCPTWIIESLISDYGEDNAIKTLRHYLSAPQITLRINTTAITDVEFCQRMDENGTPVRLAEFPNAAILKDGVDVRQLETYKNGLFHIQDLPSQIAVSKLNLKVGERVLDMCAAPGGKTFTAAQYAQDSGRIVACDIFEHRVNLIVAGAQRLKLSNITCLLKDSSVYDKSLGSFDAVICDVPCSGLGVIRRKPEIKYKENLDLPELDSTQKKILSNGLKYLKPGGRLLYSTCTLRKAENEHIVRACLDKCAEYEVEYEHTFLPGVDGTDGFYFAIVRSR
ncbi:MAG: 16S rRNA (cytosine(967)-C(5))-methyltransferase RsmB, partial [Clostridia bacterium]|nr:16S rRNA (cytosine(967)-C(5))-methyltransferase RsmB [Clostridia bacterium]